MTETPDTDYRYQELHAAAVAWRNTLDLTPHGYVLLSPEARRLVDATLGIALPKPQPRTTDDPGWPPTKAWLREALDGGEITQAQYDTWMTA